MTIDLVVAGLVLLFGALGAFSGALKQAAHWLALGLAYLLAKPLAGLAAPGLAARLGLPAAAVKLGLSAVAFYPLYLALALGVCLAARKVAGRLEQGRGDRAAGFVLGALKGAALVYVPLALWAFAQNRLPPQLRDAFKLPSSRATDFARRHNLFASIPLPALDNLEKLMGAARDPASAQSLLGDPELAKLLDDPGLKSALSDEGLRKALQSGDLSTLQNDPRIAELLKDPRLAAELQGLQRQAQRLESRAP